MSTKPLSSIVSGNDACHSQAQVPQLVMGNRYTVKVNNIMEDKATSAMNKLQQMEQAHSEKVGQIEKSYLPAKVIGGFLCLIVVGLIVLAVTYAMQYSEINKEKEKEIASSPELSQIKNFIDNLNIDALNQVSNEDFRTLLSNNLQFLEFKSGTVTVNGIPCNSLKELNSYLEKSKCSIFERIKIITMANSNIYATLNAAVAGFHPGAIVVPIESQKGAIQIYLNKGAPKILTKAVSKIIDANTGTSTLIAYALEVDVKSLKTVVIPEKVDPSSIVEDENPHAEAKNEVKDYDDDLNEIRTDPETGERYVVVDDQRQAPCES